MRSYSDYLHPAKARNLLLQGARVLDPRQNLDRTADLHIKDGIVQVAPARIPDDADIIDLRGHIITPGWFDLHVHLREPGREVAETIESGCHAAMNGGITGVACMPNTDPPIDDAGRVRWVLEKAESLPVDVHVVAAATRGRSGQELVEMSELVELGVRAFSDDGAPIANSAVLRHALEYANMLHARIFQHAEDPQLSAGGAMNEGEWSTRLGLPGIPPVSETIDVMRCIQLARYTGAAVHICHVSTHDSVEWIRWAKQQGLRVTAEVCPHHLLLTEEHCKGFDTDYKMSPPLRSEEDRLACLRGIGDGTLDVLCTDHAPHTWESKAQEFDVAPFGVVGLETVLGLTLTHLVPQILDWNTLLQRVAYSPREILSQAVPAIASGQPANLTVIDPEQKWTVEPAEFLSKSRNTPFKNWPLTGRARGIVNRGFAIIKYT
ncbi:dihydroorotase [candidate division KSB1 bacterium]|nr:MAG: dihydroorotase [candidate division KSB1 bacterium]